MNKRLLKKLDPYISINPNIMGGVPRFKDTRIPVSFVIEHFANGWNNKEIKKLIPDLKLSTINKLLLSISSELKI